MVDAGTVTEGTSGKAPRWRSSAQVCVAAGGGRLAICSEDRLSVAAVASRFSSMVFGTPTVPRLVRQRSVGAGDEDIARAGPHARGRSVTPTVAIIDSQSARTALRGDSAVTTQVKRSRVASGTLR